MKKIIALILALVTVFSLAACSGGEIQPEEEGGGIEKGAFNFFEFEYTDSDGNVATMKCGLYIPEKYDEATALPLITYIPDSTYVGGAIGKTVKGECPKYWLTDDKMSSNPAFMLIFAFTTPAASVTDEHTQAGQIVNIIDKVCSEYKIDTNRLYLTGQSMGGIMDFALNDAYPDKFAATLYVGCQPGGEVHDAQYDSIIANGKFANQTFSYIASAKDGKAPYGQDDVMTVLTKKGITYGYLDGIDHLGGDATSAAVKAVLDEGHEQNIFRFAQVTESGAANQEHMQSFQYAYMIDSLFYWLMAQSK